MKRTLSQRVYGEIDRKILKLGELLEVHPEKAPEVLRLSAWLVRFRKDLIRNDH